MTTIEDRVEALEARVAELEGRRPVLRAAALRDMTERQRAVVKAVSVGTGVAVGELLAATRGPAQCSDARKVMYVMLVDEASMSPAAVGRLVGRTAKAVVKGVAGMRHDCGVPDCDCSPSRLEELMTDCEGILHGIDGPVCEISYDG